MKNISMGMMLSSLLFIQVGCGEEGASNAPAGNPSAEAMKTMMNTPKGESGHEAAKEGAEAAKEGAEAAKEGAEAAKEGVEAAKEGAEAAKEGVEAAKEGAEAAKAP